MPNLKLGLMLLVTSMILLQCGKNGGSSGPSIPDPVASFTESGEPVTPATIAFLNTSQNADTYLWRFGDGDSTTITNPTHTYDTHGNYSVTLIAENSSTGKSDIMFNWISITPGKVYVESIRINDMPFTDQYGAGWDLFSGPDVFPRLVTLSAVIVSFQSSYDLDTAPSDLPLQWNFNPDYEITNWSTAYFVDIWDYDDFGSDYIGSSNGFRINDVIAVYGYVTTIMRQNTSGTIETVVTLRWQ